MENTKIRVENFKIGRDTTSEINSGLVILIFGIVMLCVPLLQYSTFFRQPVDTSGLVFNGINNLQLMLLLTIVATMNSFLTFAVFGWTAGGFIAALLYGNEGKNGPLYASYLIFRIFAGLVLLAVVLTSVAVMEYVDIDFAIIFLQIVVILIISLPMVIVSGISYRVGLWLSPKSV